MDDIKDIKIARQFTKIQDVLLRVKRISFNMNQFEKRYPEMYMLAGVEMEELMKFYLALGFDLEDIVKDWKKVYKEYKNEKA